MFNSLYYLFVCYKELFHLTLFLLIYIVLCIDKRKVADVKYMYIFEMGILCNSLNANPISVNLHVYLETAILVDLKGT